MVLLAVDEEHLEAVVIEYEGGSAEFKFYYEFLPEGCYVCHEVGHVARFCPKTTTTKEVSQEVLDEAVKAANEHKANQQKEAEQTAANESGRAEDKDSGSQRHSARENPKTSGYRFQSTTPTGSWRSRTSRTANIVTARWRRRTKTYLKQFDWEVIDSVGPTPMLHGSLMQKWRVD
ncbi:hypothetical protein R1sor_018071 [Riccia sorocarpa]|uniref:CCHC-type domain-containing protein n=1 Tax=Riccia sorocarpa TaxID=122646 RepID=A0ABD3IBY1_9MARC